MLQKRFSKRIRQVDAARIDLFDVDVDERLIEASAVTTAELWPGGMGMPTTPAIAASIKVVVALLDSWQNQ